MCLHLGKQDFRSRHSYCTDNLLSRCVCVCVCVCVHMHTSMLMLPKPIIGRNMEG